MQTLDWLNTRLKASHSYFCSEAGLRVTEYSYEFSVVENVLMIKKTGLEHNEVNYSDVKKTNKVYQLNGAQLIAPVTVEVPGYVQQLGCKDLPSKRINLVLKCNAHKCVKDLDGASRSSDMEIELSEFKNEEDLSAAVKAMNHLLVLLGAKKDMF